MLTRSALGAYQKANGLKLDCWPTQSVLDHMLQMRNPAAPGATGFGSGAQAPIRSGAEEARTAAIADHVAVGVIHRNARPIAAGAADRRGRVVTGYAA